MALAPRPAFWPVEAEHSVGLGGVAVDGGDWDHAGYAETLSFAEAR